MTGRAITLEDGRPMALDLAHDLLGWSDALEETVITFEEYQERREAAQTETQETVNAIA